MLWRAIATVIGVSANASPATAPANRPNIRRVMSYTSPTAATPISASGTRMLSELKPNTRTDSACTQNASGGLSTVISPVLSSEANRKSCQLVLID